MEPEFDHKLPIIYVLCGVSALLLLAVVTKSPRQKEAEADTRKAVTASYVAGFDRGFRTGLRRIGGGAGGDEGGERGDVALPVVARGAQGEDSGEGGEVEGVNARGVACDAEGFVGGHAGVSAESKAEGNR
ncbi:MAG: hypothetical protein RL077_332 [Verrucomicrobiota bacterium]|jgi:hypothetical protein